MNSSKVFRNKENSKMPSTNRVNANDLLPQTKDDLKQQVLRLTSTLSAERSRNKEHRHKLSELKQAKDDPERPKERSVSTFKPLGNKKEVSPVYPEGRKSANAGEYKRSHNSHHAYASQTHNSQDKRALSSLGVSSPNSPYVNTIDSLQREVHLLRESKHELEQRLHRFEVQSGSEPEHNFILDQSFDLSDQSYHESHRSDSPPIDSVSGVTSASDKNSSCRRIFARRLSGDSESTFIIEDFDADAEDTAKEWNQLAVENEQRVVKEGKHDRDMKESERHWQLQRKVSDLSAQSTQLEKRVTALKEENEILKKKLEEQRLSEEKMKPLKRRNAELASIARHLEERLRQLQQDGSKKPISISPGLENGVSKQTSQKTTKLKERARSYNNKDKVIETMRERFQELLRHNQSIEEDDLLNGELYAEQTELENVIKVAAKERLQLEKQFVNERHNPEIEAQLSKTAHLEQRNSELIDEVERLTIFAEEKEKLEVELMQRQIEVETLERHGSEVEKKCAELTSDVQSLMMKNTQLTFENTDLKQQIGVLDEMVNNFSSLSVALAEAEKVTERVRGENLALRERVQTLEVEIQYLDQAEQKRRQLETDKHLLQEALRAKDQDLAALRQEREYDRLQHNQTVENLELRILEIESKYKEQLRAKEVMGKELRELGKKNTAQASRSDVEIQTDSDDLSLESGVTWLSCNDDFKIAGESISKTSINSSTTDMNLSGQNSKVSCADLSSDTNSQAVDLKQNTSQREQGCSTKHNGAEASKIDGCFVNGDTLHCVGNGTSEVLQVFQAKFDYDPAKCSPNDEPEEELSLEAGDYMFVCGDVDEDGFYYAELLDGQQGLVPSNFIRKLSENELLEFYSHINLDVQGTGQDVVQCEEETGLLNVCNDDSNPFGIPDAPVNVQVESGPDHGCLMVSWLPITITNAGTSNGTRIAGYSIYVDDHRVKYLPNSTGGHILLEPEDFPLMVKPQLITIRTVGANGRESSNSLPACIPSQLLHELNANNNCRVQESLNEFAENEEISSSEELPLKSESFQKEIPGVTVSTTNPGNDHFPVVIGQVKSPAENSVNESQFLEAQNTDEKEIGRCFGETSRVHPKQNLSESAADTVQHMSRDGDDVLYEAGRCYVWRKAYHKSKLDTEFVASDLSVTDLDLEVRAWKSLDAGDLKTASDKTRSQEILGVATKRPDLIRCSSHTSVNVDWDWKIGALSDNSKLRKIETVSSNNKNSVRKSGERKRGGDQYVAASDASLLNRSARLKSVSTAEPVDSAFSDFTASSANVVGVHNEVDDVSSYSELDDNNAMTSKKICDDLPDSELIDFSDDGGESLMENVECENDAPFRIFIALFSYDPATMSPNPDAVMEELPFREGQIIKIYGEKDQDGFFLGEINHQRGLVPCNMISEVQFNDPEIAAQLLEDGQRPLSNSTESSCASSQTGDFTPRTHSTVSMMGVLDDDHLSPLDEPDPDAVSVHYVIALYDYDPQELSPNTDIDEELSFQKGDIVKVLGDVDDDGFYYGQLNDRFGLIPSNFVKEAPLSAVYGTLAMQKRYR